MINPDFCKSVLIDLIGYEKVLIFEKSVKYYRDLFLKRLSEFRKVNGFLLPLHHYHIWKLSVLWIAKNKLSWNRLGLYFLSWKCILSKEGVDYHIERSKNLFIERLIISAFYLDPEAIRIFFSSPFQYWNLWKAVLMTFWFCIRKVNLKNNLGLKCPKLQNKKN